MKSRTPLDSGFPGCSGSAVLSSCSGELCHITHHLSLFLPLYGCTLSSDGGWLGGGWVGAGLPCFHKPGGGGRTSVSAPNRSAQNARRAFLLLLTPFSLSCCSPKWQGIPAGLERLGAQRKPEYDPIEVGPGSQQAPNGHLGAQSVLVWRHSL